jgi:hypothetical protein
LMAYDCGKPESEVLLYLDALDRGLAGVVENDQSDQDGKRRMGRREGKAKSAREMTESWIQQEESLASQIIQAERETERVEEEIQTSKRRRIERNAMKARVREEAENKAVRRELRAQGDAELQYRWAREDWGRAIGWEKLVQLDKLTRPSWSEWYSDRVRRHDTPTATKPDPRESPSSPIRSQPMGKHHKIAMDNAALEALLAIDKKSRSKQQRADLTKLLNRKRNRENTRLQSLLQGGKTEEEIKQEGGVNKAYLKSIGKDVDAETPIGNPIVMKVETHFPSKRTRLASISRQGTPMDTSTVSEDNAVLQDLRDMGLDTYLASENLDIINFAALASQYAGPDISLPILDDILGTVKAYLRELMLQAILVAEVNALQATDDDELEVKTKDVEYAITVLDDSHIGPARVSLYPHDTATPEDYMIADDEPSLTDEEDNALDQAATDLDEKLDSAAELSLWQAAEELSLPDLEPDDIIASRIGEYPLCQGTRLISAYRKLLASVGHARRHRHSIKRRSALFPSTGFRVPSRLQKKKAVKSAAVIEDSDDDLTDGSPSREAGGHRSGDDMRNT